MLKNFTNLYPVSKTLRFELRPQGETMKTLEREGFVGIDRQLAQNYSKAKKILDLYYKRVIEDVLSRTTIELDKLNEYKDLYNDPKISFNSDNKFIKLRDEMRKSIIKNFEKEPYYKDMFKKGVISNLAREYILNNEDIKDKEEYIAILDSFKKFTSYFTGFFENRKNIFSNEAISTSLAYRIVDENLPLYLDNMKAFEKIVLKINKDVESVKENLNNEVVKINNINEFFTVEGFNKVLSQKGIDKYQTIIGGYTEEDGIKIQGINEKVNLYNQSKDRFDRIPRLKSLKKQILSDRTSASFKLDMIEDDEDLLKVIGSFHEHMMSSEIIDRMKEIETYINDCQGEGIFVGYDVLSDLSQYSTKNWNLVKNYLIHKYDEEFGKNKKNKKNNESYIEKRTKAIESKLDYNLRELDSQILEYMDTNDIILENYTYMYKYFSENISKNIEIIEKYSSNIDEILDNSSNNIRDNGEYIVSIKKYLDSYLGLYYSLNPIIKTITVQGKDEVFYENILNIWYLLKDTFNIYNRARNYITKKPYREDKVKLNIECASLLAGWHKNKEKDNLGVILLKDGRYYLGIMRKKHNKIFNKVTLNDNIENSYQKMVYMQISKPYQNIPHVFLSNKGQEKFNPSEKILDI